MTLLKEKSNCWCLTHSEKAGFLIDGAAYFAAVADAIDQAQKTICIAAWEKTGSDSPWPKELKPDLRDPQGR